MKGAISLFFTLLLFLGLNLQAMNKAISQPTAQVLQELAPADQLKKAIEAGAFDNVNDLITNGTRCNDPELLKIAARCLVNKATSGQPRDQVVKILDLLQKQMTITTGDRDELQGILGKDFYWGGPIGQQDKQLLPAECNDLVVSPMFNLNPVPVPAVSAVGTHTNQQNSVPSMLTTRNKSILILCACMLVCISAYKYLYQEDEEGTRNMPQHKTEYATEPEIQAL